MCYTFDHAFGAPPDPNFPGIGYDEVQRKALWNQMAQIYDNDIAPYHRIIKELPELRNYADGEEDPIR